MRTTALATAALLAIGAIVTPTASADTTLSIATTSDQFHSPTTTYPDRYTFNLVDPPFNETAPVDAFGIEVTQAMGRAEAEFYFGLKSKRAASTDVYFTIGNETKIHRIRITTEALNTNLQNVFIRQTVAIDGANTWSHEDFIGFGAIDFHATSFIGWTNGATTIFERTANGDINPTRPTAGTLFWTPFTASSKFFAANTSNLGSDGDDILSTSSEPELYKLATLTNPTIIDVETTTTDTGAPEETRLHYVFLTEPARLERAIENEATACKGAAGGFNRLFGICPTLTGLVRWVGNGVSSTIVYLLGSQPGAQDAANGLATLAAIIISIYVYGIGLLLLDPIRLAAVYMGHVFFYACLIAGYQGEPRLIFTMTLGGAKVFPRLAWYWIAGFWYMTKFVWELLTQLAIVVSNAVSR